MTENETNERKTIPLERRFTSYEMTQYILNALALEDETGTISEDTFKKYGYGGSLMDLFQLVDKLATEDGKIEKICNVPRCACGTGWARKSPGLDTNLNYSEIDLFIEQVHLLIGRQIIAPGNARDVSTDLPWFHVTEYGKNCIQSRDILPYDADGYINRIQKCSQHDEWDIYYIQLMLGCFNHGLYDAATMMLGIEGEYLVKRLIEKYSIFLDGNETAEKTNFDNALISCRTISQEYTKYCESWKTVKDKKDNNILKYPDLKAPSSQMDDAAQNAFMNYLRLTRNELAHPSKTKMEPSETMLMIVSFLKYYEIQNKFMEFYVNHS